ncbi:hypothetical protein EU527_02460 [Candidatus Thorarchaeota archaeon]|nr:MAG: hypothetical protein EU527_02460 [Candidatus Thorarchaeota archaeon]
MISQLEEQLAVAVTAKGQSTADVTLPLQIMFSNSDRTIIKAHLRYSGPERDANLIMIVGLRSDILSPFQKFETEQRGKYQPCDIPGLVPGLALLAASPNNGLVLSAISREEATRFILVFEGLSDRKGGSLKSLSSAVRIFMKRWTEWTDVLLGTLKRDPIVGLWELDWRELLAGESGFVTMPWHQTLSFSEREIGLQRVVIASKALLASVLNSNQLKTPMIKGLKGWLNDLHALPEIISGATMSEEVEI